MSRVCAYGLISEEPSSDTPEIDERPRQGRSVQIICHSWRGGAQGLPLIIIRVMLINIVFVLLILALSSPLFCSELPVKRRCTLKRNNKHTQMTRI